MSMKGSGVVGVDASSDGRTKQSFKDASDINGIVGRYRKTGLLPRLQRVQPVFADVSNVTDFHSVLNRVRRAQEAFESIPAVVRSKFGNRVENLVAYLQDPKNLDEAIESGLLAKPKDYVSPKERAAAAASGTASPAPGTGTAPA